MKSLLTFLVAALFSAAIGPAMAAEDARPEVGKYGKAFKGTEGVVAEMARIGPSSANEFLLKISRIDHDWDGKVLKVKGTPAGNGMDYSIGQGDDLRNVLSERTSYGSYKTYQLFLGGGTQIDLGYDESLSKEVLPEHLLTEYLEEQKEAKRKKK